MSDLQSYVSQLNSLIARRNGSVLAKQIALPVGANVSISHDIREFVNRIRRANIVGFCENNCADSNICGIIAFRLMALVSLIDNDLETGI